MGVPTSEIRYTRAMPRKEDCEAHKGHVVELDQKKKIIFFRSLQAKNISSSKHRMALKSNTCTLVYILLLTCLLNYSKEQSPSWEANWFAASQEIPRILWNPKAHYRTHKRPPPLPILGQPNPVYIPTSNLLEIHPNIIHPSTPRSHQWSLSLRCPHQDPIRPLSSPISATCPAHLILLGDWITFGSLYKYLKVALLAGKREALL